MNISKSRISAKFFLLPLSFALVLSLLVSPEANAGVRIGDKCAKEKQSSKTGSVKLVCLRVDKYLQWGQVSEPLTYSFGPRGRLQYRYGNGSQERLASNKKWESTDKRGVNYFHPIRVAAYESIRSLQQDPEHKNVIFDEFIQPNFPDEISRVIKKQNAKTAAYISPLLDKQLRVKLILVTEKDKNFINNELSKVVPSYFWQGAFQILDYYESLESFYSRSGTGGGTASFLSEQGYAYYIGHTSSFASLETFWPEIAPHEMSHVLQGVLSGGENQDGQQFPEGHPQAKWHGHLIEGSANTLGMAFGFDTLGWYSDEMDQLLRRDIALVYGEIKMKSISDAIKLIKRIESRNNEVNNSLSYSAGQFLWEYYVGKYGATKLIELYKNIPTTSDFNQNLKETIGISKEKFYKDAAPYMLANWQRLS